MQCPNCGTKLRGYLTLDSDPFPFKSSAMVLARHKAIKDLRAQGFSYGDIGLQVGVSKQAVRDHLVGKCKCEQRLRE